MKLIINADDFGYSRGYNYGILDGMLNVPVSATTLLMTTAGTEHALQIIKENMCYPAYLNYQIIKNSSYVEERALE